MAARCHSFSCSLWAPPWDPLPPRLLIPHVPAKSSMRGEDALLLGLLTSLPSFSPGGRFDSRGLVLMWAAVSVVTGTGDKARAIEVRWTSLPFHLISLCFLISAHSATSRLSPSIQLWFSFLPLSPLMVSFSSERGKHVLFKKKERDAVYSAVAFSFRIDISVVWFCRSVRTVCVDVCECWKQTRGVLHSSMEGDY